MLKSINPTNGKVLETYNQHTKEGVISIVNAVDRTWNHWRNTSYPYRKNLMKNLSSILRNKKHDLALLMAQEMGKIKKEGIAEIEKCAMVCDYYANNAELFLQDELIDTEASKSYVSYQPLGVILAIMPWNFPFWQVFRFAAPTLMAGNTAVLKHASNVPGCALVIEELFREAGFPENAFRTLLIGSNMVADVIRHKAIKAISLTGSTPAGKSVATLAGSELKKCVLELGGSDPYIILEDANLNEAAKACAFGRLLNAGQSCIGAKRFIVVEKIYLQFLKHFTQEMKKASFGDSFDEESTIGPMARKDLRDQLHQQVIDSVEKGAEVVIGGKIPKQKGAFYPPTILVNVKPGMPAYHEELFGPVASVIRVKDVKQAIKVANNTDFGLGAAVFTQNTHYGESVAERELQAGACFVNDFVKSDPRLPFGGIKTSGFGRELSKHGIKEFVNTKTVVIK